MHNVNDKFYGRQGRGCGCWLPEEVKEDGGELCRMEGILMSKKEARNILMVRSSLYN